MSNIKYCFTKEKKDNKRNFPIKFILPENLEIVNKISNQIKDIENAILNEAFLKQYEISPRSKKMNIMIKLRKIKNKGKEIVYLDQIDELEILRNCFYFNGEVKGEDTSPNAGGSAANVGNTNEFDIINININNIINDSFKKINGNQDIESKIFNCKSDESDIKVYKKSSGVIDVDVDLSKV